MTGPIRVDPDLIGQAYGPLLAANPGAVLPGTAEWAALPNGDPRKTAALIRAAICWAENAVDAADYHADLNDYLDQVAALDAELDRLADKRTALAVSLAGEWKRGRPSHAELQQRRAEIGPAAREIDPAATARWAATGSSTHNRKETAA